MSVKAKVKELGMGTRATESHPICSLVLTLVPTCYLFA